MSKFLKIAIACMIMFAVALVALPAFACDGCGRDGPASYSQLIQNDTISGSIGLVLSAPAAISINTSCTLAIVGYDTGDEKTSTLNRPKSNNTYMIKSFRPNGDGKTFLHIDPGRNIIV